MFKWLLWLCVIVLAVVLVGPIVFVPLRYLFIAISTLFGWLATACGWLGDNIWIFGLGG